MLTHRFNLIIYLHQLYLWFVNAVVGQAIHFQPDFLLTRHQSPLDSSATVLDITYSQTLLNNVCELGSVWREILLTRKLRKVNTFIFLLLISPLSFAATLSVTNVNDSGAGSLRDQVTAAASGDTIQIGSGITPITLDTHLYINKNLSITTTGGQNITVQRNTGAADDVVIMIDGAGVAVSINNLTIRDGQANYGAGIFMMNGSVANLTNCTITANTANINGGGIAVTNSTLNLNNSTLSNNTAAGNGGGILITGTSTVTITSSTITNNMAPTYPGADGGGGIKIDACTAVTIDNTTFTTNDAGVSGGAIYNGNPGSCNLAVTNSTFSNNTASGGAGIHNQQGNVTLINSTFTGNSITRWEGGALYNKAGATMSIINSTIANNQYTNVASGGGGGGIANDTASASPSVTLTNTIVAGNQDQDPSAPIENDVRGHFTDGGNNLIGDKTGAIAPDDFPISTLVGTSGSPISPLLAALGDYGVTPGNPQTLALLPHSPAINAGNNTVCSNAPPTGAGGVDQRGTTRPQQTTCDIGAFESQGFYAILATGTPQNATVSTNFTNLILSIVANDANEPVDGGMILFNAPTSGASITNNPAGIATVSGAAVTLAGGDATITTPTANATAGGPYTVTAWANGVDKSGTPSSAVNAYTFSLRNLNPCTASNTVTVNTDGTAITGSLREAILNTCTNGTVDFATGIGTITVTSPLTLDKNITIQNTSGNPVIISGGNTQQIFNVASGIAAILDSLTISNGKATTGGGIQNAGTLTVKNCTLTNNNATTAGNAGAAIYNTGTLEVSNSTFTGNTTPGFGGGIANLGTATVLNNTFAGNSASGGGGIAAAISNAGGSTLDLRNNISTDSCANAGTLSSNTNNIIQDGSCSTPPALAVNPLLGTFANHGGVTSTYALAAGSPAIDAGDTATCASAIVNSKDQRGITRPAACDIGSYEINILLTPTTLLNGSVGTAYNQTVTASGGSSPYTFAVTTGALPGGLALNSTTGVINGTPSAAGTFNFTITATDSASSAGSQAYTVTITATITLTPATLPAATVGTPYNQTVGASGGTSPYTFAITSGALPAGLTLNTNTGSISGTPTAGGTFNLTITATDAGSNTGNTAYTLTVNSPTITVSPVSLASGTVNTIYNDAVSALGGTSSYTFAVTAGALPTGLSLNATTGVISGTPTAASTFNFTVTATDSSTGTGPYTGNRAYSVTISPVIITLSPGTLPTPTVGTAYNQTVTASGGTGPYTFAVTVGALPTGLTLSTAGVISGTATAGGTFNFTITATDSASNTGTQAYTFTATAPTITVSPATLPNGGVGTAYNQTVSASNGISPYTFAVTVGALPTGLTLNTTTGIINGTPTAAGTFNFTITATDSSTGTGPYNGSKAYTITISAVAVSPATLPGGTTGTGYTQTITASGGTGPYTFAVTAGTLPTGLTLNGTTGVVNGTPSAIGTFNFTVTATDSVSIAGNQAYTLAVCSNNLTVANNNDMGSGSLREAITNSCTNGTIDFAAGLGTITLATPLSLTQNVTIQNTSGNNVTLSGNNTVTVFDISAGTTVTLDTLTISNGNSATNGGGINNAGLLTLKNSTLTGNNATNQGGAIYNANSLVMSNVTLSGNTAGTGSALFNTATATALHCTIANNNGSGLHNTAGATLQLSNSIISDNSGGDCNNTGTLATNVKNLIKDNSCTPFLSGSPLLGILGTYGGITQSYPLLPGSPAIDAADGVTCAAAPVNSKDQRGITRPASCDIGSFESQGFTLTLTMGDSQSTTVSTAFGTALGATITPVVAGEPVEGGIISFTAPGAGASINPAAATATITAGAVSQTVTANAIVGGPYTVNATATGIATPLAYNLTNTAGPTPGYGSTPAPNSTINFATIVGSNVTQTLTIQETGTATLNVTSATFGGADSGKFNFSPAFAAFNILDGGADVPLTLQCDGSVVGTYNATLQIAHNAAGSPANYNLSCVVSAVATPGYSSTPAPSSTINFATIVGSNVTQTLTIQETGTATLNVTSATFGGTNPGKFSFSPAFAAFNILDGGADVPLTLQCDGSVAGTYNATLQIVHNAAGSPANYNLSCVVSTTIVTPPPPTPPPSLIPPTMSLLDDTVPVANGSTTPVNFGTTIIGAPLQRTFRINNDGEEPLNVTAFTLPTGFSLVAGLPITIAAKGTNGFIIQLDATTAGTFSGILSLTNNDLANNPYQIVINGTVGGSAVLTLNKTLGGNVVSTPTGINCGSTCTQSFIKGTTLTLAAVADAGFTFVGWSGACNANGIITLTADSTCTATFKATTPAPGTLFSLSVNKSVGGNVTSTPSGINCGNSCVQSYPIGTTVTLTALPDSGFTFGNWTGNCAPNGVVTMMSDSSCTVQFVPMSNLINLTVSKTTGGKVTSNPGDIDCGNVCSVAFPKNSAVSLVATPDAGFVFNGWTGGCAPTGALTLASDSTCTANFAPATPPSSTVTRLTISKSGNGKVTSIPSGIDCGNVCSSDYPNGTSVSLIATPDSGSVFTGWSGSCAPNGVLTVAATSNTCAASFATTPSNPPATTSRLTVSNGVGGKVTSNPAGIDCGTLCSSNYPNGTVVNLTATPDPGFILMGWSGSCAPNGVLTLTSDSTCIALFTPATQPPPNTQFTLTVFKTGGGNISSNAAINCGTVCSQSFPLGTQVTLTPVPDTGYTFMGWTGNCNANGVVTMAADNSCTAFFASNAPPTSPPPNSGGQTQPQVCPTEGFLNWLCNAEGKTIQNLEIGETGSLSDGVLAGTIVSKGWVSGLVIKSTGKLQGGIVSGYIANQGVMTDFEFRGALLMGGTLAGTVRNTSIVGGILQDVLLAANTRISGGRLQGDIVGNAAGLGLLENLSIAEGSRLSCVIIGNNVQLPKNVVLGKGVRYASDSSSSTPTECGFVTKSETPLPVGCTRSNAVGIDRQGKTINTTACFGTALKVDQVARSNNERFTLSQSLDISATLNVDPAHIGQTADVLIVAVHQTFTKQTNYMRIGNAWKEWDAKLDSLQASETYTRLPATVGISIYTGQVMPGEFTVFVGYRLQDGTIIYNGSEPRHFWVGNAASIDLNRNTPKTTTINEINATSYFEPLIHNSLYDAKGAGKSGNNLFFANLDTLKIATRLRVDPRHVGQAADILMVAVHKQTFGQMEYFRDGETWRPWDNRLESLKPAQSLTQMPAVLLEIPIHLGQLTQVPGEFMVYVGYRLQDGVIIFNGINPIHLLVTNGLAVNGQGQSVSTTARFVGWIYHGETFTNPFTTPAQQPVGLAATIVVDPSHVGLEADILMVAIWQQSGQQMDYQRDSQHWWEWNENLLSLKAAVPGIVLKPIMEDIRIFQGILEGYSGRYTVYIGYRLPNGLIVYNGAETLQLQTVP